MWPRITGRPCWKHVQVCVGKNVHWSPSCAPTWGLRNLGTGDGNDNDKSQPSDAQVTPSGALFGRLGSRRRPLSPLERVSLMVPAEALNQDVWDLKVKAGGQVTTNPHIKLPEDDEYEGPGVDERPAEGGFLPAPPTELPLRYGELVLAEYCKKKFTEFRKMFLLQEKHLLQSSWGYVRHSAIIGQHSGSVLLTSDGSPMLIRRPSLEEYVLLMRRGAAIVYPKDSSAVLMMMDVNQGDCVLESGSGSGAMALFLSRAVGSQGSVLSVEVREDHHVRAVKNYQRWRKVWKLRRGEDWPDNVQFHIRDLGRATELLSGRSFNSICLDMLNPQIVLPKIFPHLQSGGVCIVYLASITQVVDLLEGVRVSCTALQCERIIEVQHRDWLVTPAIKKDGNSAIRVAPGVRKEDQESEEFHGDPTEEDQPSSQEKEDRSLSDAPFGTKAYIARPHHEQMGHSAFLVKLRKVSS